MYEISAIAERFQSRKCCEMFDLELPGHCSFRGVVADGRGQFTNQVLTEQDVINGLLDLSPLVI